MRISTLILPVLVALVTAQPLDGDATLEQREAQVDARNVRPPPRMLEERDQLGERSSIEARTSDHSGSGSTAGSSCSGSKIDSGPVGSTGRWELYYSSAGGGTNCLMVRNTSGRRLPMWAYIKTDNNNWAGDRGDYIQYAGPVRVAGAAHKCVEIYAQSGNTAFWKGPFHCG